MLMVNFYCIRYLGYIGSLGSKLGLIVLMISQTPTAFSESVNNRDLAAHATASPILLPLNAKQQASLGIQLGSLQPAKGVQLLVPGTVVAPAGKEFTVSAPYAGQITRLMVGVGDAFKVGAALAQFTSPALGDARRMLSEAEIDFKNAKSAAQRDQAMFDEGIIPAVRLQLSLSKQEAALALLKSREAELNASGVFFDHHSGYSTGTLKAPLSGTVVEAFTAVGQRVEPGTVLFKLADTTQLQLELNLSSDKAAQLQVGDEVSMVAQGAKARILAVARSLNSSQLAKARAVVTQRGSLQIGEMVSVTVFSKGTIGSPRVNSSSSSSMSNSPKDTNANSTQWLIPSRALTQFKGLNWIFLANEQGFLAQSVTVLSSSEDMSTIELPLSSNTRVAFSGIASLRAMLQKDE